MSMGAWAVEYTPLGSDDIIYGKYKVISDIKVNNLQLRHVRYLDHPCDEPDQVLDQIEMSGRIDEDTTIFIKKLVKKIYESPKRCTVTTISSEGELETDKYSVDVYLNSGGGYLKDGYELGRFFREYGVTTRISSGSQCYSSCATAFLGGLSRTMRKGSNIMFHAPYTINDKRDISCMRDSSELKDYIVRMIKPARTDNKSEDTLRKLEDDGELLYERTMSYCGRSTGWFLNEGAAFLMGITNVYKDQLGVGVIQSKKITPDHLKKRKGWFRRKD